MTSPAGSRPARASCLSAARHDAWPMAEAVGEYIRKFPERFAAPQAEPCIGNDSACPCQDGDACHYKDTTNGTKAWPVPQAEPKREPLSDERLREVLIAEARRIARDFAEPEISVGDRRRNAGRGYASRSRSRTRARNRRQR